jgi:Abnormal spindle-like microcephaly-assoc'd, ASPM-SPD-2-Hydin
VGKAGLAPQQLTFPPQYVGQASPAQSVSFYNRQSVPINISGVSTSGGFSETTTCKGVLKAHARCSIRVTFKPTSAGDIAGFLNVSDSLGTQRITLVGFGTLVKLFPGKS